MGIRYLGVIRVHLVCWFEAEIGQRLGRGRAAVAFLRAGMGQTPGGKDGHRDALTTEGSAGHRDAGHGNALTTNQR
jgi:hypothetical protein